MQPIAENTYDFEEIRRSGMIYVDKTGYFHQLITTVGRKLFFVSRPRRFGKSLMLSTLRAIFEGRRELFDGLAISDPERNYDWQTYQVIHFIFSGVLTSDIETFRRSFANAVESSLRDVGYQYDKEKFPGENFRDAIKFLHAKTGKDVVLLIDEYDSPIGHVLDDVELATAIRKEMANFYVQIKDNVGMVRFMMMTGVSRFAKLSVFSALSSLTDLTFDPKAAGMLGYTHGELDRYFSEHMKAHAEVMNLSDEEYRAKLKWWFDSYRFSPDSETLVYNPVSIGVTMANRIAEFRPTWSKTGHASTLVNYLRREPLPLMDFENVENVDESVFDIADLSDLDPVSMLYQTGYLTIKGYSSGLYTLGVPNEEVRRDLNLTILVWATSINRGRLGGGIAGAFRSADPGLIRTQLESLYASMNYHAFEKTGTKRRIRITEASYMRIMMSALRTCGFELHAEEDNATGRADLVAIGFGKVYVFEFKRDESARKAMNQIKRRKYHLPYADRGLPVYALGLNFDSATHCLVDFRFEKI